MSTDTSFPSPNYRVADNVMVRTPLLAADLASPQGEEDDVITAYLDDPALREALWVASPSLARLADAYRDDPFSVAPKKRAKLAAALHRYGLRSRLRPTPFGLFSGVGTAGWGERLDLRLGPREQHRRFARLDFGTVQALVKDLEADPGLRTALRLYANSGLLRRGRRVFVPSRDSYGSKRKGEQVSVRLTRPVEEILDWCETPVSHDLLVDKLAAAHQDVPNERLRAFVGQLLDQGVLLSTLRPTLGNPDPLSHVLRELDGSEAPAVERLRRLDSLVEQYRNAPFGEGTEQLRAVYAELSDGTESTRQQQVQVDLRVPLSGTLPTGVGDAARQAVDTLFRITPMNGSHSYLEDYTSEFLSRYGSREVPLLELLDETSGLGPPATYENPRPRKNRSSHPHDSRPEARAFLRELVGRAERDDLREVVLEPGDVDHLPFPDGVHPPSIDLFMLVADGAAEDGGWLSVITPIGAGFPAGRAYGRFHHLHEDIRRNVDESARHEREASPDVLVADLSYAHPDGHVNNLLLVPKPHRAEITLGVTPVSFDRHVPLTDIVVGLANGRLYARSRAFDRRIIVRTASLVIPTSAPNAVRFLMDLSEDALWRPGWDWGEVGRGSARLPRVRVGRAVLVPARWNLPLRSDGRPNPGMDLDAWRTERDVPRFVYAGAMDNRLLLDLDSPTDVAELRNQISQGVVMLEEALPGPGHSGIRAADGGGHLAEAVVSLLAKEPERGFAAPADRDLSDYPLEKRLLPPGRDWWYFRLYGPESLHDPILRELEAGLDRLGAEWFYLRYLDPLPHLRVRVRTGVDVGELFALTSSLLDEGLVGDVQLGSYDREVERYGGTFGLALSERVFCAESPHLARLRLLSGKAAAASANHPLGEVDDRDLAALSVDTMLSNLGLSASTRVDVYDAMQKAYALEFEDDPRLTRRLLNRRLNERRPRLRSLLDGTHPLVEPGGLLHGWRADLAASLAPLAGEFTSAGTRERFTSPPETVAQSLLHLHANRLGVPRDDEYQVVHRLHGVVKGITRGRTTPSNTGGER